MASQGLSSLQLLITGLVLSRSQIAGSILFCFPPPTPQGFLGPPVTNYMLLYSTSLYKIIACASGGRKKMSPLSGGGGGGKQNRSNFFIYSVLKKIACAPGGHKRFILTKLGGGQNKIQIDCTIHTKNSCFQCFGRFLRGIIIWRNQGKYVHRYGSSPKWPLIRPILEYFPDVPSSLAQSISRFLCRCWIFSVYAPPPYFMCPPVTEHVLLLSKSLCKIMARASGWCK